MRIISISLSLFVIASCSAAPKEKTYTGSTPAAPVIRSFLGIPLSDSIDFIRWQLFINGGQYHLHANYGIGQPNTNGFYNGGVKMELSGALKKEKNSYYLQNGNYRLGIAELNEDLLHLLNDDNSLLVGNGGWSYTLNNMTPSLTDQVNIKAKPNILKDSMSFEGRTPCGVPGLFAKGTQCYKLKWYVVLYAKDNQPAGFRIQGTSWRKEGGITGSWKMNTGKNGTTIYQLNYQLNENNRSGILYLLKLDDRVLVFTDANGKLLVGDEDFSYTLNRRF